jgi:hypothetical protein
MPDTTIIIPIGPDHMAVAERAVASARSQTIPAVVDVIHDRDGRGPGWARNMAIGRAQTRYILFLDADDWLEPHAIEYLEAAAAEQPGQYIYCDWQLASDHVMAAPDPCRAWRGGTLNVITALLPTEWVVRVGGFDEDLPGGEDTDFFLKLITSGLCGWHLEEPLLHYTPDGARSKSYRESEAYEQAKELFRERYGDKMGCCGDKQMNPDTPAGERQDNDVLTRTLWGGNKHQTGRATGRRYPRSGNGKPMWVDPRDIAASPKLWAPIDGQLVGDRPVAQGVHQLAQGVMGQVRSRQGARYTPAHAPQPGVTVADIIRMGQELVEDK